MARRGCRIVNAVSSASTQPVYTELVSARLGGVPYEPEVFPGLIYGQLRPKCEVILFGTGRIASTGMGDIAGFGRGILAAAHEISRATGRDYSAGPMRVENTTAVLDVGHAAERGRVEEAGREARPARSL